MFTILYVEEQMVMFTGSLEECERYYARNYAKNASRWYKIYSEQQMRELDWEF